jgi:hypothetical protein
VHITQNQSDRLSGKTHLDRLPFRVELLNGDRSAPVEDLAEHLLAVENELNNRPRLVLADRSPAELFAALLASTSPSVLRR